jgi:hypothetical protein
MQPGLWLCWHSATALRAHNNTAIGNSIQLTQAAKPENMPAGVHKCAVMFLKSGMPAACISSCVCSLQ